MWNAISHYLDSIVSNIFTGGSADSVIAILLLMCFFLFVITLCSLYFVYYREKQNNQAQESYRLSLKDAQQKTDDAVKTLLDYSYYVNEQMGKDSEEILKSYTSITISLVEVKALLNTLVIFQKKN